MKRVLWLLLLVVLASSAWAAEVLELDLVAYLVTQVESSEGMSEVFEEATVIAPGDLLEWRLKALNRSDGTLSNVGLVVPLPEGTAYLDGSALPYEAEGTMVLPQFSFDGGQTFGYQPLFKTVLVTENGVQVSKQVEVEPSFYTHARWTLDHFAPDQYIELHLRTLVR